MQTLSSGLQALQADSLYRPSYQRNPLSTVPFRAARFVENQLFHAGAVSLQSSRGRCGSIVGTGMRLCGFKSGAEKLGNDGC